MMHACYRHLSLWEGKGNTYSERFINYLRVKGCTYIPHFVPGYHNHHRSALNSTANPADRYLSRSAECCHRKDEYATWTESGPTRMRLEKRNMKRGLMGYYKEILINQANQDHSSVGKKNATIIKHYRQWWLKIDRTNSVVSLLLFFITLKIPVCLYQSS